MAFVYKVQGIATTALCCVVVCAGMASAFTTGGFAALQPARALRSPSACAMVMRQQGEEKSFGSQVVTAVLTASLLLGSVAVPDAATAAYNFPPVDKKDTNRCEFKSSAMGQSNAARDKLYDLRACDMKGKDATGFDIAGAIMLNADFSGVNFKDAVMSKVYGDSAKFDGAIFNNAIMDRSSFKGASFKGAVLANTVLSGTSFQDADLTDADFSDAYMGAFDSKNLCKNPTLKGTNPKTGVDTRESAACAL